jgi:hypothetical protein
MSEAYQRFLESMKIDYYKWHDGIGYDLEALRQLAPDERNMAEKILLSRGCLDWRDVDALDVLGTEAAISELKSALRNERFEIRIEAMEKLALRGAIHARDVEKILVETIPHVTILNGLSFTFRLAERYPTEAVKQVLLRTAMEGHDDARCHAAALAEYLYGVAKSSFDFERRDFYLRFNEKNRSIRKAAYLQLCQNVHIDPNLV